MRRYGKAFFLTGCVILLGVLVIGLVLNNVFGTSSVDTWVSSHPTTAPLCINLNTATETELLKLPEMTRTLAKRILEYRDSFVLIRYVEEICSIRGVTDELYELWRPHLIV